MLAALAPEGAEECQLAEAIILDQYRMARARELENEIFFKGIGDAEYGLCPGAETWTRHSKDLALLTLYSQRIHRVLVRNQADLAARQAARKAATRAESFAHPTSTESEPTHSKVETAAPEPSVGFIHSSVSAASAFEPSQAPPTWDAADSHLEIVPIPAAEIRRAA